MATWDPIGVADAPQAHDEYDAYLDPLASALRSGADTAAVARYLADVESQQMGLGGQIDQLIDVAESIVSWYSRHAPR